jgi:hypothetical protein
VFSNQLFCDTFILHQLEEIFMRFIFSVTIFCALFSCSKGGKGDTTKHKEDKTLTIPKLVVPKPIPRFGKVPPKIMAQFESLALALKTSKGSIDVPVLIGKYVPGFIKVKGNNVFFEDKGTVKVLEVRKKRLYAIVFEMKTSHDLEKDEKDEDCDAQCKKEREKEMKEYQNDEDGDDGQVNEGEGDDGPKEEVEPGHLYVLYLKRLTRGKMTVGVAYFKESSIFYDPKPKVTFSPFFKETGAFMISYEDNSLDNDGDDSENKTVDGGITTILFSLDDKVVKEQTSFDDGATSDSWGITDSEHNEISWRKGKVSSKIYLIQTSVISKRAVNTGDDLDEPPFWTCSKEYIVTAIPLKGHKWKVMKAKDMVDLRKYEPIMKNIPKDVKIEKSSREEPKACSL